MQSCPAFAWHCWDPHTHIYEPCQTRQKPPNFPLLDRALHIFVLVLSCACFFSRCPPHHTHTSKNGQPGTGNPCGPCAVEKPACRCAALRCRRAAAAQPSQPIRLVDGRTDDDVAVTQCSGRPHSWTTSVHLIMRIRSDLRILSRSGA